MPKLKKMHPNKSMIAEIRLCIERLESSEFESSDLEFYPTSKPAENFLCNAATLIPIFVNKGELSVIFTKRASHLKHHAGQISFPGGKMDKIDSTLVATAEREVYEEISLEANKFEVIGKLPSHKTVTGFLIHPFVAIVYDISGLRPNFSEVAEIFFVPLDFLLDPSNIFLRNLKINSHFKKYYAIPYGPYYIWGATARIVKSFSDGMNL